MQQPISDALLARSIQSKGMLASGRDYFQKGKVGKIELGVELDSAMAPVRGSGSNIYIAIVFIDEVDQAYGFDSECTCPIGFGCKHVAALLYALQEQFAHALKPALKIEATKQSQRLLGGPVEDWVNQLRLEALSQTLAVTQLRFVIEPKRLLKPIRAPKGTVPKGRPKEGTQLPPRDINRYLLQIKAYRHFPSSDEWRIVYNHDIQFHTLALERNAARLMARMAPSEFGGDFASDKTPSGRFGWQWLDEAIANRLLFWKNPRAQPVTLTSDLLKTTLEWTTLANGSLLLDARDVPSGTLLFAGDPPVFFDETTNSLGLIDTGLDITTTAKLLKMPPVEVTQAEALAERWPQVIGSAVPPPRVSTTTIAATPKPKPVLHFMSDKVGQTLGARSWQRHSILPAPLELVRLEFDYGGHRVMAPAPDLDVIASLPADEGGQLFRFSRDLEAEQAAVDQLASAGLLPLSVLPGFATQPHQAWDHVLAKRDEAKQKDARQDRMRAAPGSQSEAYLDFMANHLDKFANEGWRFEYDKSWRHAYQPIEPGQDLASLSMHEEPGEGRIDWFDVELAALVEGQRVDILPALRRLAALEGEALLEHGDEHRLPLMLTGGRFTSVALKSVRPLIETLLRLALADPDAKPMRLSRFDLGVVYELGRKGAAWSNQSALRQLAARLHDPEITAFQAPEGLVAQLRPYQQTGASWLKALYEAGMGGILADDMGLGKTLQAITHILALRQATPDCPPVLVVGPTSVLPNWQAEIERFAPGLTCHLWHGPARQERVTELDSAHVILTSHALLVRDCERLGSISYSLVVLDEAHVLKNPTTAGFKAAASLKTRQTIALTGTPVENRLNDIWALASLTNPGLLGSFEGFRKNYRTPIEKHNDQSAKAALARRLRPFMLRRTKDEVATDLPAKSIIPERIELGEAQMRLYESQRLLMNQRVREEIDRVGAARSQIVVLDAMLKLRQICCDPALLASGLGKDVTSAKRSRLLEMLPELLSEGRRVILFSQFTSMLDLLKADLAAHNIDYEELRGSTRDRAKPVRRFQEGEVSLILVSLKAGGAGINLTAADTVILYDPWWNPAVEAQAIDRAHRIGQNKPVFVHRLISKGTIEEKILLLQERKQGLADMLWDEQARAGGPGLDDDDIAFLLG